MNCVMSAQAEKKSWIREERDARTVEADAAKRRVTELEDELCAARESLRRVIKTQNRAP